MNPSNEMGGLTKQRKNIRLRRESNPRLADFRPRARVSPSRELETSSNFIVSLSTLTDTAELIIGSIICVLSASGTTFSPLIDSLRKPAAKFNTKLNDCLRFQYLSLLAF